MKFAHIADSHLGAWRQPELQQLNLQSFKQAIETCINEKVGFILFTGDLFDTSFPSIEILKETFAEFKRLKDTGIKSYVIAGSHDFSVSGKTFLELLEKAGFCEICQYEETEEEVILKPLKHETFYIYGYPGKKSGLEIPSLKKIKIQEPYENNFRILMLHTTITEIKEMENLPIETISLSEVPPADYYALGHIHIDYNKEYNNKPVIYGGPTYPNNFKELEELKHGCFYIIDVEGYTKVTKKEIKIKEPILFKIEIEDSLNATQKILSELQKQDIKDKIVLLRVFGTLKKGKQSDINFKEIEEYIKKQEAYSFLKNTSKLEQVKTELQIELQSKDVEKIEEALIKKYEIENPSELNKLIFPLIESLNKEKQEGETSTTFENRLLGELNKVLKIDLN
ncbi:MAG: exonuclease SbcCD subunit D [archaeon]